MRAGFAAVVLVLLGFVSMGAAAQAVGHFSPTSSTHSGPDFQLSTASSVELLDPADKDAVKFLLLVRDVFRRVYRREPPSGLQVYRYTYAFTSAGQYTLRVNFSDWDFVHSPFTDIIQDYSFVLKPGETKTFRFLSYGTPRLVNTPVNVGIWKKDELYGTGKEKWRFAGIGSAAFWIPEPLTLWMALP
jgi:hypothetical protein